MSTEAVDTLIVGAGPAGLAVAGRLARAGRSYRLLEAADRIADSWERHYDRLHLHTIKQYSALPHLPFPAHYPTYVSKTDLLAYYHAYVRHFDIRPLYHTTVTHATRHGTAWKVQTDGGRTFLPKHLVVCTGYNRRPYRPQWPGQTSFAGTILHSRSYQNPRPFVGHRTLVIGMGNTGAEVALDLSDAGVPTYLSVRGPINIVPRDFRGRPVQRTAKLLRRLPQRLGDWISNRVQAAAIGDLTAYGIATPRESPARQLRERGKTPVIDLGTVAAIRAGRIKVVGDVQSFLPYGVRLADGTELSVDHVILATGYRTGLADWLEAGPGVLDERAVPAAAIYPHGLYFVGFDVFASGLLDSIYRDSERVVAHILRAQTTL